MVFHAIKIILCIKKKKIVLFPVAKLYSTGRTKTTMAYKANILYENSLNSQSITTYISRYNTHKYTQFIFSKCIILFISIN